MSETKCSACHGEITGPCKKADDLFYHAECVRCSRCRQQIGKSFASDSPGVFVCESCAAADLPRCAGCSTNTSEGRKLPNGDVFCAECFQCCSCRKPITGRFTGKRAEEFLCPACAQFPGGDDPSAVCATCRKPIPGPIVEAGGVKFHADCFTCHWCGQVIAGMFYPHSEGYQCLVCHTKQAPLCASCGTPCIEETRIAKDKHYHPECLKCATCKEVIPVDLKIGTKLGKIVCEICFRAA